MLPKMFSAWQSPSQCPAQSGELFLSCPELCELSSGENQVPAALSFPQPRAAEPHWFPSPHKTLQCQGGWVWATPDTLCSWCLGFLWLVPKEMRQPDTSSHRYVYSSMSVQLGAQCMREAAVSETSLLLARRVNPLLVLYQEPTWMLTCFQAESATCTGVRGEETHKEEQEKTEEQL